MKMEEKILKIKEEERENLAGAGENELNLNKLIEQKKFEDEKNFNKFFASFKTGSFEERPKYIMLEKTKAMYTLMHPYLERFPKSERFTLGAKIEETILDAIKLLIFQNYQQTDEERKKLILEFLANFYLLEVLLQQSATFKYLSYEGFNRSMSLLREINSFALARYKHLGGKT